MTDNNIPFGEIDLKELAELRAPERAFLSVYLSPPNAEEWLAKRVKHVRELVNDSKDEAEYFNENLKKVEEYLEKNPIESRGIAIFVSWVLDFFRAYPLDVPVKNMLRAGPTPFISPLAELQDEYENFAVVVADNKSARIFVVTSATPEEETGIEGNVKNHVKKGGWSQQRYERRRDKQLMLYAKEIGEKLLELDREVPFRRIIMVGSKESLREIKRFLPEQILRQVRGDKSIDLGKGEDYIQKEIFNLFDEAERLSEERLWEKIRTQYLAGGLAVVGPNEVLCMALQCRVEALIVTRDVKIPGVRCRKENHLLSGEHESCPVCGATSFYPVDLVNEIVSLDTLCNATVDFVDPIPALQEVGDIAALLRY
jgi:peptide subunit release factor 1 (eRF1)